ncbi:hypothetical protein IQ07DRAFT_631314 [Pyrenochaeta sp. DS3sAY3a]|nr:hypothetical protein IQ07DRAFT_631314 [Pyrenochaeta sp. DS3sAY3a]
MRFHEHFIAHNNETFFDAIRNLPKLSGFTLEKRSFSPTAPQAAPQSVSEEISSSSASAAPAKPFRLLDLPRDVRFMIYEEMAEVQWKQHTISLKQGHQVQLVNPTLPFGILCTCRSVYDEAFDIMHRRLASTTTTLPRMLVNAHTMTRGFHYDHEERRHLPLTDFVCKVQLMADDRNVLRCIRAYRRGNCNLVDVVEALGLETMLEYENYDQLRAVLAFVFGLARHRGDNGVLRPDHHSQPRHIPAPWLKFLGILRMFAYSVTTLAHRKYQLQRAGISPSPTVIFNVPIKYDPQRERLPGEQMIIKCYFKGLVDCFVQNYAHRWAYQLNSENKFSLTVGLTYTDPDRTVSVPLPGTEDLVDIRNLCYGPLYRHPDRYQGFLWLQSCLWLLASE